MDLATASGAPDRIMQWVEWVAAGPATRLRIKAGGRHSGGAGLAAPPSTGGQLMGGHKCVAAVVVGQLGWVS